MVGYLPARVQPQRRQRVGLLGAEVGQGVVGHVVGLQGELLQVRQPLRDRTYALVANVDAVGYAEAGDLRVQRVPQPRLRDFVAAVDVQLAEAREVVRQGQEPVVGHWTRPQTGKDWKEKNPIQSCK